jgi:metal-sulfur cluster biosynthetic enzyme
MAGSGTEREFLSPLILEIWNALGSISDPCHRLSGQDLSILDLGLVNHVTQVGKDIEIGLTLTEVSCTFGFQIIEDIEALSSEFPEFDRFRVRIEPFPLWNPTRLSERALAHYRADRRRYGPRLEQALARAIPRLSSDSPSDHPQGWR